MHDEKAARILGWTSIAIGVSELAAPKKIEQAMGLSNGQNTGTLRVLGVREIMHGVDILTHKDPTTGVMSRVAGDVLDGVLLGCAAKRTRRPAGFALITAMVLGVVALDIYFAKRLAQKKYAS
jgi:hypothetical protein